MWQEELDPRLRDSCDHGLCSAEAKLPSAGHLISQSLSFFWCEFMTTLLTKHFIRNEIKVSSVQKKETRIVVDLKIGTDGFKPLRILLLERNK